MRGNTSRFPSVNSDGPGRGRRSASRWTPENRLIPALRRPLIAAILMIFCAASAFSQEPSATTTTGDKDAKRLGERLVRKAVSRTDEDVMEAVLRLMDEAARKLQVEFDAGGETQALQTRILERLDEAIRLAVSQRRSSRGRPSQWIGEKRKTPARRNAKKQEDPAEQAQSDRSPDAQGDAGTPGQQEVKPLHGELRELRRAWGLLPQRQREQIIQGSGEAFLERYREWIERYYHALQEAEE